jgi:hypothetical protein
MGGPHKGSGHGTENTLYYQKVVILLNCHTIKDYDTGALPNSHVSTKAGPVFPTPWYKNTKKK